ncbi:MAG: AzlC family ABC transporter permease [Eubacteriales bacterium]
MSECKPLTFIRGARDGLPVGLGYLSVAFAFGMIATAEKGMPLWGAALVSLTNFTGTGQFVGVDLMSVGTGIIELVCTLAVINARYFLMSLSLSQKLPENITLWQRMMIAFGNTDENFALMMLQSEPLTFPYMMGMIITSYSGWVGGTILGGAASAVIPSSLLSALGIALYAMFIALVVPPAKADRRVLGVVAAAAAISCALYYIPASSGIGSGWIIIISGVLSSAAGAVFFPHIEKTCDITADVTALPDKDGSGVRSAENTGERSGCDSSGRGGAA